MSGIDLLIAKSFSTKIKKNLEPEIEQKIKIRLFEKYGISIKQSIEDFSKFDKILKEFLKTDSKKFEQDCLSEIITIDRKNSESVTLTITERSLVEQFLEILGDRESRKIIMQTTRKSLLISEILDLCKLSQTSGYRKVNYLIRNGFLIKTGNEMTNKKRMINRLSMFCKKITIQIDQEAYQVKVIVPKKILEQSTVIQTTRD